MSVKVCTIDQLPPTLKLTEKEILVILAQRHMAEAYALDRLDQAEQARYHAYLFEPDRQRHLLAHSLKRQVLSHLIGQSPTTLQFHTDQAGKPRLAHEEMHFNLSHSGNWVALAFHQSQPVGIDIEQTRALYYQGLLTQIAHPEDQLPRFNPNDESYFLASWSMKEAASKCAGKGLSIHFPTLRLTQNESGTYTCTTPNEIWHIHHIIHEDAHLAVASPQLNQGLQIIQIENA